MCKDIKINEAQQVKDAAYVTVVLTDGSLGKIAKNDLIELFKTSIGFNTVLQDKGEAKDDLNTYKSTGYYDINYVSNKNANFPPYINYGGLIVISCNQGRWVLQIAYSVQDNQIRTRSCNDLGAWQDWHER